MGDAFNEATFDLPLTLTAQRPRHRGRVANFEPAWKTLLEEKSSYSVVPITQGGIGYRPSSNVYGSEARLFVKDIPLLDDADDVGRVMSGFYWTAGAYGTPWPGCTLFQSEDGTVYAAVDTALAAVTWVRWSMRWA